MKPLSSTDDPFKPLVVNEVSYTIDSDHVDAQWTQPDSCLYNQHRTSSNSQPVPKTSILMPGNVQIHRQVPLSDAKNSKETKIELYKLLQYYDAIVSKSENDIGQTDLIKMHIATKQNIAEIAAQWYLLVLKHHDFLKQEIKNLLDAGIIHNPMSPWASPLVIVKKHLQVYHKGSACA